MHMADTVLLSMGLEGFVLSSIMHKKKERALGPSLLKLEFNGLVFLSVAFRLRTHESGIQYDSGLIDGRLTGEVVVFTQQASSSLDYIGKHQIIINQLMHPSEISANLIIIDRYYHRQIFRQLLG